MKTFNQLKLGLGTYGGAIRFIFANKMAKYFIYPLIFSIILFIVGFTLFELLTTSFKVWVFKYIDFSKADFPLHQYLSTIISWIIWIASKVLFFFLFIYFGGYVIQIVMSPVLAAVSEKTDQILTGNQFPMSFKQTVSDIIRGIRISIRNMLMQLLYTILLFIIGLIPLIGFLNIVILFFITCYFYGFSFMDYSNERRRISVKESLMIVSRYKSVAIGNGFLFALVLFIPVIGMAIACYISIISVVASTLAMHEVYKKEGKLIS